MFGMDDALVEAFKRECKFVSGLEWFDSIHSGAPAPDRIVVTNGAISVTNPGSTVIIDGTSDMFRIAHSATCTWPAATGGSEVITTITLSLGLAYPPAMIAFLGTSVAQPTPSHTIQFGTGVNLGEQDFTIYPDGSDTSIDLVNRAFLSGDMPAIPGRYYVLVQAAL